MVVSGALVWCHRDGKLLPLRLDSIKLSGDLTEAHWNAVTQFLDLVASQRLVIHDEGVSVQSPPRSPVPSDIAKFSDNFANLIQEQECAKKYALSDNDGLRTAGGLGRLSRGQQRSAEDALLWPVQPQEGHVEDGEKEKMQQKNLNKESEIVNVKVLRNVGETQEIILGSKRNVKQDPVHKFGISHHDEGWIPETCEETHKVATVSKCGQQQRRRKIGHVSETLNIQYMLQKLRQQVGRTEEVVAVLNCQECEQTRHMPEKGDTPSEALRLQYRQMPSEALASANCHQREIQENGFKRQVQEVNASCGVESFGGGRDCCNLQNCLHWTDNGNSSSVLLDNVHNHQDEVQKLYPQRNILKTEPREYTSKSTSYQSVMCQMSGKCCVNRLTQGACLVRIGDSNESMGYYCTTVSQSVPEISIGNPSSVQEAALHHQQQVFAVCEQCEFELSKAVLQISGRDEDIKHVSDPNSPSVCCCRLCVLDREVLKVGNNISVQIPRPVTTHSQSQCNLLSGIHVDQNGHHGNTNLRSLCDCHINEKQVHQSFHQRIQFPHIGQSDGEQHVRQTQTYELDQRVLCSASPVSDETLPRCQTSHQLASEERISGSGIPVGDPTQTKYELNIPVCQQCDLENRVFETVMPRNKARVKCQEYGARCQDCQLQIQRKTPEVDQVSACQQCAADTAGRESSVLTRYQEEGVHRKKKRAVALWQRLLRKHVTYSSSSSRRKLILTAVVQPSSSAPRP
jgi:hypothetical protein